jgi:hypothetical protein
MRSDYVPDWYAGRFEGDDLFELEMRFALFRLWCMKYMQVVLHLLLTHLLPTLRSLITNNVFATVEDILCQAKDSSEKRRSSHLLSPCLFLKGPVFSSQA